MIVGRVPRARSGRGRRIYKRTDRTMEQPEAQFVDSSMASELTGISPIDLTRIDCPAERVIHGEVYYDREALYKWAQEAAEGWLTEEEAIEHVGMNEAMWIEAQEWERIPQKGVWAWNGDEKVLYEPDELEQWAAEVARQIGREQ